MGCAHQKGETVRLLHKFEDVHKQLVTNILDLHHLNIDYQTEINYQYQMENSEEIDSLKEKQQKILKKFDKVQDFMLRLNTAAQSNHKQKEVELLGQAGKYMKSYSDHKLKEDLTEVIRKRRTLQMAKGKVSLESETERKTISVTFLQEGPQRFIKIISPRGRILKVPFKKNPNLEFT